MDVLLCAWIEHFLYTPVKRNQREPLWGKAKVDH